ncbi:RNA polymerase II elongation factor ELL2-like [Rhopilema esculentum]|uniref:RNA polymerase II elongation factor ELL2-like n=1 Tax=Rhopilema esculentum TaxID=499914 RepID=UPI0031D69E18
MVRRQTTFEGFDQEEVLGEEMENSLVPNETYSLSTKEETNQSKELFFVKLTDSSLRAVEEYLENKAAIKGHPKIQFFGPNGLLHLPSRPGSASQDVGKNFKFSCSFFARDGRQGITECLHQPSKHKKMLGSMGMIEKKIAVMGTDEAYEMTRNKMAQADQERKGVRTKEIKINHSKSKKKITPVGKEMNNAIKKKLAGSSSLLKPINGLKPATTAGSSSTSKGSSCKDRVIHILAIRPHKKLEIFSRLQREGINQKERNTLGAVLQQVATMQDNSFKLNKHYYNEIKPDTWPYYSEAEKTAVKESLAQLMSQDSSPKVSSTSKSPEEKGIKRQLNDDYNHLSSKKQRIAKPIQDPSPSSSIASKGDSNRDHNSSKKRSDQQTRTPNNAHKLSGKTELSKNGISRNGTERSGTKLKNEPSKNEISSNGTTPSVQRLKTEKPVARISPINSYMYNGKEARSVVQEEESSPPTVASTSDIPDHVLKYQPIKSYEQRCKYKQDFQAQYREYIELKENIDRVSNKFLELDRIRRKHPEDSQAAQEIKQKIFYLYEEHQKDEKYQEMKQKYADLYARLSHIKKLVVEYDQKHFQVAS